MGGWCFMQWRTSAPTLRCAVDSLGTRWVIHFAGELDSTGISGFHEIVDQVGGLGGNEVVLELSRLTHCSAAGARAIHQARAGLRERGVSLELRHPHDIVRTVLELSSPPPRWWDAGQAGAERDPAHSVQLVGVMEAAMQVAGTFMGTAQYFHLADDSLHLTAHRGFDRQFTTYFQIVGGPGTSCAAAASGLRPVFVEDVTASPVFAGTPDLDVVVAAGVGSCASIPILAHGRGLLGVVSVHRPVAGPWTPAERDLLDRVRVYAAETLHL